MLQPRRSTVLLLTLVLTWFLLMLGAFTRLSDSGLGCPDWPGCYGKLLVSQISNEQVAETFPDKPLETSKAWIEMAHRYLAGLVGLLVLSLAVFSVVHRARSKNYSEARPMVLPLLILMMVGFQSLLGMWTVTKLVHPVIVSAHLLGGMVILAMLWYLYLKQVYPQVTYQRPFKTRLWLVLLIGQIILGAWVSTNYAALSCTDFPGCFEGKTMPEMNLKKAFSVNLEEGVNYEGGLLDAQTRATIHMVHRIGALVVFMFFFMFLFGMRRSRSNKLKYATYLVSFFLVAQVGIGIATVYLSLPMYLAVLHNGMAALLLLSSISLRFFSHKRI